jgi:hypothetical protein
MRDDWIQVIPSPGDVKNVARELLLLATSPAHVRTDGNGSEFRVPPYLAELYNPPSAPKRRAPRKKEGDE